MINDTRCPQLGASLSDPLKVAPLDTGLSEHARRNRAAWNADADDYQARQGSSSPPTAKPGAPGTSPSRSCTYSAWIRLFRANGFEILDLIEPRPAADAVSSYRDDEDRAWAPRWPAECIGRLRRVQRPAAEALTASRIFIIGGAERRLLEMSGELLSSGPEADQERRVRSYFLKPESRILYWLFLRGTKHFGYYPPGSRRPSMAKATQMMEDKLGTTLTLPPGSWVLDAGCGEGDVAIRMATKFGLHMEGVDLLEFSLDKARKKARKLGLEDLLRFQRMDYANLRFPDQTFDGAYTMETLVHAFDHERALQELLRVLKPGGRLVLFEYSIAPRHQLSAAEQASFDFSVEGGAMASLPSFIHGAFPEILERAGFTAISVQDITERMIPMLKRFAQIGYVPYQLGKLLRLQGELVNCTSAVQVYRHRSVWRYNIVTAERPG